MIVLDKQVLSRARPFEPNVFVRLLFAAGFGQRILVRRVVGSSMPLALACCGCCSGCHLSATLYSLVFVFVFVFVFSVVGLFSDLRRWI